jgi:hypothetical protein
VFLFINRAENLLHKHDIFVIIDKQINPNVLPQHEPFIQDIFFRIPDSNPFEFRIKRLYAKFTLLP